MARFSDENLTRAKATIALYPEARSALIPLCHLAQAQDGYLTEDAMEHIASLVDVSPAEVRGTASFYDMLHTEPVGRYVIAVCTNIACMLVGGYELLDHALERLSVGVGQTTEDGRFTIEEVECIAACDLAPCLAVNHRFFGPLDAAAFDTLLEDLGAGRLDEVVPPHGVLNRVERSVGLLEARSGRLSVRTDASPIVTRRLGFDDAHGLSRYLETDGYLGLRKALQMTPDEVAAEVDKASLLGRGGAGFPAGRKWSFRRKAETTYLVVNGDESEPATFKDHLLIERDPHQIIEGTIIAAYAVGAAQAFVFCRGEFALGLERLQQACNEAYAHGALGQHIFGSEFSLDLVVHPGAGAYICGEETALLESLEGKRGFPRIKPPYFPAAIGLYGEPTIVNNIETVSNLPWIVEHGGAAFAALGQGSSTGTRLFALSGRVNRPGWYELEMSKTTFRDLIYDSDLGGGVSGGAALKAFIPGGVSAPWFGTEHLDLGLDQDAVGQAGSMLGSGSIVVIDEHSCAVRAAWRITRFFHRESCGQCTPCREGSSWLEQIMRRIEEGYGRRNSDLELLLDACDNIAPGLSWPPAQTTICVLGPSIPSSIASAIKMFRDEFLVHIKDGGCPFEGRR